MADEGDFDPCECIYTHDMAMRRLLSLLRQSQSYCTDTECFQNVVGQQNQCLDTNFVLMGVLFAFALFMFYMRPRTQTSSLVEGPSKSNNDNGSNGFPPTPPTAF